MKKFVYLAIATMLFAGCATQKKVTETNGMDYTAEEIELVGYGRGVSTDWNTARSMAKTAAIGELSMQLESRVRTASSNYMKKRENFEKVIYESITEVVSQNNLRGVTFSFSGDSPKYNKREYVVVAEARLNQTIFRKTTDAILDELDATDEERDAFRREMFGE